MELSFDVPGLRVYLISALLAHKLIWEVLKKRSRASGRSLKSGGGGCLKLIKLLKMAVLACLVVQTACLVVLPMAARPLPLRILGITVFTLGLATAVRGRFDLGKNWVDLEDFQALPGQAMVTHGIYRFIRHPIYAGDFLLVLGLELALNSWLVLGTLPLLVIVFRQARAEEALLTKVFSDYGPYRAKTKMFLPFLV